VERNAKSVNHPTPSAKNETGEFGRFKDFMKRLVAVPHAEVKAKLDAEKRAKQRKRAPNASSASRASRAKG